MMETRVGTSDAIHEATSQGLARGGRMVKTPLKALAANGRYGFNTIAPVD